MPNKFEKDHRSLPCYVIWGLSLSRNTRIFEGKELVLALVAHKIRLLYGGIWKPP